MAEIPLFCLKGKKIRLDCEMFSKCTQKEGGYVI